MSVLCLYNLHKRSKHPDFLHYTLPSGCPAACVCLSYVTGTSWDRLCIKYKELQTKAETLLSLSRCRVRLSAGLQVSFSHFRLLAESFVCGIVSPSTTAALCFCPHCCLHVQKSWLNSAVSKHAAVCPVIRHVDPTAAAKTPPAVWSYFTKEGEGNIDNRGELKCTHVTNKS